MVGAAGCEVLDVGREENTRDVLAVGFEVSDGDKLSLLAELNEVPDVDHALGLLVIY